MTGPRCDACDVCTCGHPKADHYAGECRRFLNPASVICACRVFTPGAANSQPGSDA